MSADGQGGEAELRFPLPVPPGAGEAVEVAPGILWARLPLPMALDHVNVYALDDGDGWTLVDTGLNSPDCREGWDALLAGPLSGKPIARVLMTHHHPDHVGLVGRFAGEGASIVASRTAYLLARMLTLDVQERPTEAALTFANRAGITGERLEARRAERPFNFADAVMPIPLGVRTLGEGETFRAAGRDWIVRLGEGHAPAHVTLWSDDVVIAGDQVIPGISPNIGVWPTEPEADPLAGWLETCRRFLPLAEGRDPLVLPGHKLPFRGLAFRLHQLIDNHEHALDRVLEHLRAEPDRTAEDLFLTLFKRRIGKGEHGLALAESVAHLNHLLRDGRAVRRLDPDGACRWRASAP